MSENVDNFINPPGGIFEEHKLKEMIAQVGFTQTEFVDACVDFHPNIAETYNWHKLLVDLWVVTYARIHSVLDFLFEYQFTFYNDWKDLIDFTLTVNRLRFLDPVNYRPITLTELEEELKNRNMSFLPSNQLERIAVFALISVICQLHNYMCAYPRLVYAEILEMRKTVDDHRRFEEERREVQRRYVSARRMRFASKNRRRRFRQ